MPDGKRNSLPSEGEPEGVHCFYDDELQNATGLRRKLPLTQNPRSFDRLLKTMVANEIKNTLNGEDNKKLVAHHRPVLHSESDSSESEMVVVGVVLNPKQAQNEEVTKALEMLRRNGVRTVSFTIKDLPQNGEKTDDANADPCENGSLPSTNELFKSLMEQHTNENTSPTTGEQSDLSPAHKKVSSPTVSTTSDYASPTSKETAAVKDDDAIPSLESDTSCTSTTSPAVMNVLSMTDESEMASSLAKAKKPVGKRRNAKRALPRTQLMSPPTLSPSPPVLFPQVLEPQSENPANEEQPGTGTEEAEEADTVIIKAKVETDETALRRKKRRKRMYPYVSRRKPRNKRKKDIPLIDPVDALTPSLPPSITPISPAQYHADTISDASNESNSNAKTSSIKKEVDPYEFEDSDIDGTLEKTFKTPSGRNVTASPKRGSKSSAAAVPTSPKKKSSKRSPRKRLTFSKSRAISPDITADITDHGNRTTRRQMYAVASKDAAKDTVDANNLNDTCTSLESCVQPISTPTAETSAVSFSPANIPDDKLVLPHSNDDDNRQYETASLQPSICDDESPKTSDGIASGSEDKQGDTKIQPKHAATTRGAEESVVQLKSPSKVCEVDSKPRVSEFVVPAPPDDSLHDAPDSMQLRRSSFYSSISRNVRTNLEKYLDGRPPDLKQAKRSKKIKNGFLLHHGDNFPDDPEAPYRLHLATQVLLKLNKRRVKCKPKEDKGKSLLSYLKLQPKRVSRVGKNSKASSEVSEVSATNETTSVFSGEWTVPRKYVCNICGQVESEFWDMVMHKGEVHPGIVVTHVELNDDPPEGFRRPPSPRVSTTLLTPPPCTKCGSAFTTYPDLHRHIFECAGNAAVLDEGNPAKVAAKKKGKRKRGFNKRRISSMPKKNGNANRSSTNTVTKSGEITKRRNSEVFKCEFCTREFKTEGWLKNHVSLSHSLPISIPLNKLSLPTRASFSSSRRFAAQVAKPTKQVGRES